ncbi:MAG: L-serine ammonia-lyase, iron-sulfur-dependent, subunit alpha [Bacilli bacterium]|nr:L-serine ammonia-lyase, iron-sulfur-dependent, subunit alpha [Bacilli bacterium]
MQSIRTFYKVGRGPSSSHTMGPYFASLKIKNLYPEANRYVVTVYNSLALTGEGHLTYQVIQDTLAPHEVVFHSMIDVNKHPNTLMFEIYKDDSLIDTINIKSIGGGEILINDATNEIQTVYPHTTFSSIKAYCITNGLSLYEYVKEMEGPEIDDFLYSIWNYMKESIASGLKHTGILPGKLKVVRKAKELLNKKIEDETDDIMENRLVSAYAFAVSEENAAGGMIVTAPTCGASGVLPAVLYYMYQKNRLSDKKIIKALAVAALFGNVIRQNATISGAVGGCQAEVGSACSMAAAAHASLSNMFIEQIEYAAEVAMEHHLGLTCDPIDGYVQIPCIERNAVAAIRAINASRIAYFLSDSRKISFDMIVETMYQTGLDMHPKYKETAEAGMAYFYKKTTQ